MYTATNSRRPAWLCGLALLIAALASFPVAEIGMNDDWSYVKTARVLAATGHIVYNGWATAMLGWILLPGALFVRLFGPSYTSIRASTLVIALATTFLTQRTFLRAGVNARNATTGALTLALSPLFLPLALSYMSDIGGLFTVVLCLYACLRALQAQSNRAVLAWLAFAALSNAVGGTARQIAWLGVIAIFPCAVWLLRRRPHVLLFGAVLYAVSGIIVFAELRWFQNQLWYVPDAFLVPLPDRNGMIQVAIQFVSLFFSFALFLLPVLIAFVPAVSLRNKRAATALILGGLAFLAGAICVVVFHPANAFSLIAPFKGTYATRFGLAHSFPLKGFPPVVLPTGLRLLLTVVVLVAILCFLAALVSRRTAAQSAQTTPPISIPALRVLLIPYVLAYLGLLLPRGLRGDFIFDRYLLLLLPVGLILLLRIYQDCVSPNLPRLSIACIVLFALFAVAGTHDAFAMYRARLQAINELRAAGVPDNSIDGGFEHNGITQIERYGFINYPNMRIPAWAHVPKATPFPANCKPDDPMKIPGIVPGYTLSYDPSQCGGLAPFAPVTYSDWLIAGPATVYIVNTIQSEATRH